MKDITVQLENASGNVVLPTDDYTTTRMMNIIRDDVTIDGNGSTLTCSHTTNFNVKGKRFTLRNFVVIDAGVLVWTYADKTTVADLTVKRAVQVLKTDKGGTNATALRITSGKTQTVTLYFDADGGTVKDCDLDGVIVGGEYPIRVDVNSSNVIPDGFTCTNSNVRNGSFKDTIGLRSCLNGVISGCDIVGNVRFGQVPKPGGVYPTKVGQWASIKVSNCNFVANGSVRSAITVGWGSDVSVTNCSFKNYQVAIVACDQISLCKTSGLIQLTCPTVNWCGQAALPRWVDGGGNAKPVCGKGEKSNKPSPVPSPKPVAKPPAKKPPTVIPPVVVLIPKKEPIPSPVTVLPPIILPQVPAKIPTNEDRNVTTILSPSIVRILPPRSSGYSIASSGDGSVAIFGENSVAGNMRSGTSRLLLPLAAILGVAFGMIFLAKNG